MANGFRMVEDWDPFSEENGSELVDLEQTASPFVIDQKQTVSEVMCGSRKHNALSLRGVVKWF